MEDKNYCVYIHTNKINNKVYIGMTSQKPHHRWGKDGRRYDECPMFWRAIQKYGWDNFSHKVIMKGLTREQASAMEIAMIEEMNALDPRFGYNLSSGGDGFDPRITKTMWGNDSFRADMSRRMREAWKCPDKRRRRSMRAKERWANPDFHKRASQAVAKACGKPVRCIETGDEFQTVTSAADAYGLQHSNISRSAKIGYKCGGYHWEYIDGAS